LLPYGNVFVYWYIDIHVDSRSTSTINDDTRYDDYLIIALALPMIVWFTTLSTRQLAMVARMKNNRTIHEETSLADAQQGAKTLETKRRRVSTCTIESRHKEVDQGEDMDID
jgi:hypothetical protein